MIEDKQKTKKTKTTSDGTVICWDIDWANVIALLTLANFIRMYVKQFQEKLWEICPCHFGGSPESRYFKLIGTITELAHILRIIPDCKILLDKLGTKGKRFCLNSIKCLIRWSKVVSVIIVF